MPPRAVCVKCGREMKCIALGARSLEKGLGGDMSEAYKIWSADLYQCPECGSTILTRFADNPISEHFRDDFEEERRKVTIEFY